MLGIFWLVMTAVTVVGTIWAVIFVAIGNELGICSIVVIACSLLLALVSWLAYRQTRKKQAAD